MVAVVGEDDDRLHLVRSAPGEQLASPGGHCVFTLAEVQGTVALLMSQVAAQELAVR